MKWGQVSSILPSCKINQQQLSSTRGMKVRNLNLRTCFFSLNHFCFCTTQTSDDSGVTDGIGIYIYQHGDVVVRVGSAFRSISIRLKTHTKRTERHPFYDAFPPRQQDDQELGEGQLGWWDELEVRIPLSVKKDEFWSVFDTRLFSTQHSFQSQHKRKRARMGTRNNGNRHQDDQFMHAVIYGFEVMYMLLSNPISLQNRSAGFESFFALDKDTHLV